MLQRRRSDKNHGRVGFLRRNGRLLLVWLSVAALLAVTLLAGCSTATLSNDPKNLFAQAEPATVWVQAEVAAHISVPQWKLDNIKIYEELYSRGLTPGTAKWATTYLDLIVQNPIAYLDPDYSAAARQADTSNWWWGSGFIADPNGYVVTNAHVAAPSDDEIKTELAAMGLQKFVNEDLADLRSTGFFSASRQQQLSGAFEQWMIHYLTVSKVQKNFSVVMGANIAGTDVTPKVITADVVTAGSAIPGKDVAILKIEGQNYPTMPVGDDTQSNVGDKLYVIGYPGAASGGVNEMISIKSLTEPTFTTGVLSAKKQATEGFQVIQTDAAVTHGNSGGPVLNAQGQVVGIATFGSLDPNSGAEVQGFNFVMPSTLIKQFLDRSGAHPAVGQFTQLYTTGLAQESASHFKDAKATFQQIEELAPGNPYVTQHISQDESAIASGKDTSLGIWPMVGIGLLVVLVVGGGIAALVINQRKKGVSRPIPAQAYISSSQPQAAIGGQSTAQLPAGYAAPVAPAAFAAAEAEGATVLHETPGDTIKLLVTTPSGTREIQAPMPAIIGRGQDCQVTLDDSEVSRHHVQLAHLDGGVEVTDLGSSNGTRVNEDAIAVPVLAHAGDHIKLGHSEVVLE